MLLPRGRAAVPRGVVPVRHPLPARALFGAAALAGRPRLDRCCRRLRRRLGARARAAGGRRAPFVLTVHDRSWEQRPGTSRPTSGLARRRPPAPPRPPRRAGAGDTEVGREDLIRAWGLPPTACAPCRWRRGGPGAGAERRATPTFLFVGALEPRKAPDVLVDAFRRARARGLEAELVVVGEGRLPRGPGVRRLGRVDDLGALYAGALAVVLPSRLEGFGLPPVEALAPARPRSSPTSRCSARCWATARSTCRPATPRALADALLSLERDPALRARLLAAGRAAGSPRSRWAETARRTRAVLAEAA